MFNRQFDDRRNPYTRPVMQQNNVATPGAPPPRVPGQPMGPKGPATGAAAANAAWAANRPMGAASQWQNSGVGRMPTGLLSNQPQQLWQGLNANSNPYQIARAYNQWAGQNGGNTAANQQTAQNYLLGLGMGMPAIQNAYNAYQSAYMQPRGQFGNQMSQWGQSMGNPYGGPEFFGGNN